MEFAYKKTNQILILNPLNVCAGVILCGCSRGPVCPNGKMTMLTTYDINLSGIDSGLIVPRKIHPKFLEDHEIDELYYPSLETLLRLIMPSKREVFKKDGNLSKYGEKALSKATTFVFVQLESIKDKLVKVVEAKDFETRLFNLVNMFELNKSKDKDKENDDIYKDRIEANNIFSYFDGDEKNDKQIFVSSFRDRNELPYYAITQVGMEAFKKFILWILICLELGFRKLWDIDAFQHFVNDIMMHD